MAQIYKLNLRDSSREADIEQFKKRIVDCPSLKAKIEKNNPQQYPRVNL